ncbi:hypothetical protein D3C72_727090 [compost metagenome]
MVGHVAVLRGQLHHLVHHHLRVARARADLQAVLAQPGEGVQGARDQRRVHGDLLDLQRHEAVVDGGDIIVGRGAAEHLAVALGNFRHIAQGADVVPLAHAHRAAGFFDGHLHIEFGKGFDKDLGRGEGTEVDHGAGPVKDGGLQLGRVAVVHVRLFLKLGGQRVRCPALPFPAAPRPRHSRRPACHPLRPRRCSRHGRFPPGSACPGRG